MKITKIRKGVHIVEISPHASVFVGRSGLDHLCIDFEINGEGIGLKLLPREAEAMMDALRKFFSPPENTAPEKVK